MTFSREEVCRVCYGNREQEIVTDCGVRKVFQERDTRDRHLQDRGCSLGKQREGRGSAGDTSRKYWSREPFRCVWGQQEGEERNPRILFCQAPEVGLHSAGEANGEPEAHDPAGSGLHH